MHISWPSCRAPRLRRPRLLSRHGTRRGVVTPRRVVEGLKSPGKVHPFTRAIHAV